MQSPTVFHAPKRLLMGPGPSDAAPSVLKAMAMPLVGHLDPSFIQMMEEIKGMLRSVFQTTHNMTFPVSGTGSAGMEFCMVNLVEPGDEVVVCINGVFGMRMAEVAERCGAKVIKVEAPQGDDTRQWGPPFITRDEDKTAAYFHSCKRGKKSVTIDFRTPEGQARVRELVRDADILIENFKRD